MFNKSLIASGSIVLLALAACSTDDTSTAGASVDPNIVTNTADNTVIYQKNDAKGMWMRLNSVGIASYFDSLSQTADAPIIDVASRVDGNCAAPALQMDANTRYLDELESLFDEGEQVPGMCGKGLKLNDGQAAPLGVNLLDSMKVGTVEFWFRPNEDFFDKPRTMIGNDGSRIHFFYKDGKLYFQKNHHNQHYFVKGATKLDSSWNLIAGQWGDGYMSLWVNGKLVASKEHGLGYAPATRGIPFENLVVIGYKSGCCMEGAGQYDAMTTSGSFDQFRISNITRYSLNPSVIAPADTTAGDTLDQDTLVGDTSAVDTSAADTTVVDTNVTDTTVVDTTAADTSVVDTMAADTSVVDTMAADTSVKDTAVTDTLVTDTSKTDTSLSMWTLMEYNGVSNYLSSTTLPKSSAHTVNCAAPALAMDDSTLYLDELEAIYREGELVEGVCGKALSLKDGEVAPLGISLVDSMPAGTVEFWFRPNEDFFDKTTRTLLGNDGSRVQFLYSNGNLIFQKNHSNRHMFVQGKAELKKDWNLIAGQWGNDSLSIWVNGEKVASIAHSEGYAPSEREELLENILVIGYKSSCCMEGLDIDTSLTTSGAYDQVRISNIARYTD